VPVKDAMDFAAKPKVVAGSAGCFASAKPNKVS
jgi:hypothetical protein